MPDTSKFRTLTAISTLIAFLAIALPVAWITRVSLVAILVAGAICVPVAAVVIAVHENNIKSACTAYTLSYVAEVEGVMGGDDRYSYITVVYGTCGQQYKTRLACYEKPLPGANSNVGICYDPERPWLCMLHMYKMHKPGWSRRTRDGDLHEALWSFIIGIVAIIAGFAVASWSSLSHLNMDSTAYATVVDYEIHTSSSSIDNDTSRTYYPIVEFKFNDNTYRAKQVLGDMFQHYDIGDTVRIRFNAANTSEMAIIGSATTVILFITLIAIGAIFVAWSIYLRVREVTYPLPEAIDYT